MKYWSLFLTLLFVAAACSSSQKSEQSSPDTYPNLMKLSQPDTTAYDSSNVYIDSVATVSRGLLIAGNLPDGCSTLHEASHTMQGDSLHITLTAWRPADKMCTQALTPFTFIYEKLSEQQINEAASLQVNGKTFEIQ